MLSHQYPQARDPKQELATNRLHREERARFMPWILTLFAVFSLGAAVRNYVVGYERFALILTGTGAVAVVLLLIFHSVGRKAYVFTQFAFAALLVVMLYAFLLLCDIEQAGLLGALCMVPALIAVCGYRVAGWLLLINFPILIALLAGLVPWWPGTWSSEMSVAFLTAYAGLGIFVLVVDFNRDCSRNQLVDLARQFDWVASHDELTDLPNRREMERMLGTSMNRYHLSGESFSVVVSNIDNYKNVNDRFGHQFGDQLLAAVSKALHRGLRSDDILSRWDGDEFLVLLRGQNIEAARQVAERLRRNVSNLNMKFDGDKVDVTMSFGVAFVEGHETVGELISAADRGLYQAKNMGRNMVVAG